MLFLNASFGLLWLFERENRYLWLKLTIYFPWHNYCVYSCRWTQSLWTQCGKALYEGADTRRTRFLICILVQLCLCKDVMRQGKSILALLLARGGSKGVPGKNLKLLDGKPLIYFTIKAIQDSNVFDRFVLSTDSQQIADVAQSYGVEVPFLRPEELAQDDSHAADAIVHALKWIEKNDKQYDYVQYIFPTSPFRTAEDICNGIDVLFEKDADMVISVCQTSHPLCWANELPEGHSLKGFIKPEFQKNRQELAISYRINGSIYVGKWDIFYEKKDYYAQNTFAYIMPSDHSVDIDSELHFKFAEFLFNKEVSV